MQFGITPAAILIYSSEDIVHGHIIIIRKCNKVPERNFTFSPFISAV